MLRRYKVSYFNNVVNLEKQFIYQPTINNLLLFLRILFNQITSTWYKMDVLVSRLAPIFNTQR
jgi:hypothetical protein